MGIGQAYGHNLMTYSHHEGIREPIGQVKLFESHFASFLHLGLILAVLRVLNLVGRACSACLKLNLDSQCPVLVKLVVSGYDKARNGNGVALHVRVSSRSAVKAVDAVVLELSHDLSISAQAIAIVRIHFRRIVVPLGIGLHRTKCKSYRQHT